MLIIVQNCIIFIRHVHFYIKNGHIPLLCPFFICYFAIVHKKTKEWTHCLIYTPPRGTNILENLTDNLLIYLNDDQLYTVDPLITMCVAHYQFEAIHPFPDGNGRTGRVLYLVHKRLLDQSVLYLSKYIIINKDDYYYHLNTVTQRGAWKPWIMYMLDAVENMAQLTSQLISSILNQMEATLEHGRSNIKWHNKDVNELILASLIFDINLLAIC